MPPFLVSTITLCVLKSAIERTIREMRFACSILEAGNSEVDCPRSFTMATCRPHHLLVSDPEKKRFKLTFIDGIQAARLARSASEGVG